jgi:pre-mRNA-processing factor 19
VPPGWVTPDEVAAFDKLASDAIPVAQASSIDLEGGYAAVSGLQGDVGIYSLEAAKLERTLKVNEPVTDTLWAGKRIIFATSRGSVKIFESGSEIASFSEHAGPATGLALHPSGDILASVGTDKSFVFYDLASLKRVTRVYTDSCRFLDLSCP